MALLLRAGADPNMLDPRGRTLLHTCALDADRYQMARLLLAAGASVTMQGTTGVQQPEKGTPLLFAINAALPDTIRLLILEGGADPVRPHQHPLMSNGPIRNGFH